MPRRFKFTAPCASLIPAGAIKVADKASTAVAYLYEMKGQPCVLAFIGNADKPALWLRFRSPEAREKRVRELFASVQAKAARVAKDRADRFAAHSLEVGTILRSMWGYDQTNIDFYQVTRLIGRNTVELVSLSQVTRGTAWAQGTCLPGSPTGKPFQKRVDMTGGEPSVNISGGSRNARPWCGKAEHWTAYA